jgi:hypothetical protein
VIASSLSAFRLRSLKLRRNRAGDARQRVRRRNGKIYHKALRAQAAPGASPRPLGGVAHLCVDALFRAEDPLLASGNPVKV